ncbi:MAG: phosphatidylserine/phosphatidylglycerophosphate/cardiolipin synthase family protein [Acidobacteria bacterium]|nr:phosphatidylserine/phosphatidylglycerophosphate/cardiolipin synthase family protein [Acidobacteriota bacterium]
MRAVTSCCADHPGTECIPWPTGEIQEPALYFEGDDLYDSMRAVIRQARRSIDVETYILAADEVGRSLAAELADRSRAGVQVRVSVDAIGSGGVFSRELESCLEGDGIEVRRFARWSWRHPSQVYRRDHRKLLVIDDRIAYLGGFNIHRESSRRVVGRSRWRDTHVRVEGRLAAEAGALFDAFWSGDLDWSPDRGARGDVLVPNHSRTCRRRLHCLYNRVLRSARLRLDLTTPYFVPDRRTRDELLRAARRGVDVRLLLPAKSDVPLARWAARAAYRRLLDAGVRIYEYQPRMLHAKTAVVDRIVATAGTANLDSRSLLVNHELNLFSATRVFCENLIEQFEKDLESSTEVTSSTWPGRPRASLLSETVGRIFRRWL